VEGQDQGDPEVEVGLTQGLLVAVGEGQLVGGLGLGLGLGWRQI